MRTLIDAPRRSATELAAPSSPPYAPARGADQAARPQSLGRRVLERFALIAFGLYHVPLFLNNYPSLGGGGMDGKGLAISWGHVYAPAGVWVARHVLHLTGPMPNALQGDNGDVGEEFGRLLLSVVIAAIAALCWTFADRRRPRARWAGEGLRLLLRYAIALGIASYAIAKILPVQFPRLDAFTLEQRVGELPPMSLLWDFMRYSRPYAFFGGLMELLVVLLLCFRRTTTLGALLCLAVMTNVALLNFAYGVPVKLYSTMIVVSAAVLVLYDVRRLVAVFVSNETVIPAPPDSLGTDRVPLSVQWTLKVALVGSVLLSSIISMGVSSAARDARATSALDGAWTVTEFSGTATPRWRRVIVGENLIALRMESDSLLYCGRTPASTGDVVTFACAAGRKGELRWTRSGDTLQLTGSFAGAQLAATARQLNPYGYRLLARKFRWVEDF